MQVKVIKRWRWLIYVGLIVMSWQPAIAQDLVVVDWDSVWKVIPERRYIADRYKQISDSVYQFGRLQVDKLAAKHWQHCENYGRCCFCSDSIRLKAEEDLIADQKYLVKLDGLYETELPKIDSLVQLKSRKYLVQYVKKEYPDWLILSKRNNVLYVLEEYEKTTVVIEILQRYPTRAIRDLEQSEAILQAVLQEIGITEFLANY